MSEKKEQQKSPMGGGMSKGPVEKAKNFKGTFKRLVNYVKPYKFQMFAVFFFAILSTTFAIAGPTYVTKPAMNKLADGFMLGFDPITKAFNPQNVHIDLDAIASILLFGIALYIFSTLANFITQLIMAKVSQRVVSNMREEVDYKLTKLPLSYFDRVPVGQTLSRVTNDIEMVNSTLQQGLTQMITSVITIIGYIIMMLSLNIPLTFIAVGTLPVSIFITVIIGKNSQKFFAGQQVELGDLNGQIEEVYSGHNIIKAFNQEDEALERFQETNRRLYKHSWKAQFVSGLIMPVLNLVGNIGYVLIAVFGVQNMINGKMNLGDVQAFIQYMQNFTQPIVQTANISNVIQSTVAAAERVFELLDEQEQQPSPSDSVYPTHVEGDIKFEHVNFGYVEGKTIINDLSLHAKPGQTVAIVGPTGAGKTTLVNLLMRFYEINSGEITIDGVKNSQMKRETVRGMFGMVLQDTWLFSGSIKENIRYSRLEATDEEVYAAAKAAHVDDFVRSLPQGYDTIINEDASNISQGQKQLLTIARAILADPTLLILDEATSSVDTRTEVLIQKAMNQLMNGRTSFVIAHRLSTIKNADSILVMNHGDIIEQGNHDELIALNGFYANLYNSQFSEEM